MSSEASARGCVLTRWSLCVCACVCVLIDSSNTDASHFGEGPVSLVTSLQALSPNNHTLRSSGSNKRILGGQSSVHNRSVRKRTLPGEGRGPREPVCGGRTPVLATGFIYLSGQICRKLIFKIMVNKANTSKAERIFQKVPDLKDCPDRRGVQVVSRVSL